LLLLPWRRWHRVTLHWLQLKIGWFLKLQTKHVCKQSRCRWQVSSCSWKSQKLLRVNASHYLLSNSL
jgi:hypothetical protein